MSAELHDAQLAELWAEIAPDPADSVYPWRSYSKGEVQLHVKREEIVPGKAWVFSGVFSVDECQNLIRLTERFGYSKIEGYPATYRNNTRFILKSEALAEEMFSRLKPLLPAVMTPDGDLDVLGNGDEASEAKQADAEAPPAQASAADAADEAAAAAVVPPQPQQQEQQQSQGELAKPAVEAKESEGGPKGDQDAQPAAEQQQQESVQQIKAKPWLLDGLNPHWRACKYDRGGVFRRHLDGSVIHDRLRHRSWYTCMLYLNSVRDGGATRFFERAPRPAPPPGSSGWRAWAQKLKFWDSKPVQAPPADGVGADRIAGQLNKAGELEDWSNDDDDTVAGAPDLRWAIQASVPPEPGQVLVFYPDQWHDGERVRSDDLKYIVRTEVMFRR